MALRKLDNPTQKIPFKPLPKKNLGQKLKEMFISDIKYAAGSPKPKRSRWRTAIFPRVSTTISDRWEATSGLTIKDLILSFKEPDERYKNWQWQVYDWFFKILMLYWMITLPYLICVLWSTMTLMAISTVIVVRLWVAFDRYEWASRTFYSIPKISIVVIIGIWGFFAWHIGGSLYRFFNVG